MNKKQFALTTSSVLTSMIALPIVNACALFGDSMSDLSFANYQDYMPKDLQSEIGRIYSYQEFGDLPELENFIREERIALGVGSDFFNASLAERGLISKVDFAKVFSVGNDRGQWANKLASFYSPETWKLLNTFRLIRRNQKGEALDSNNNITTNPSAFIYDVDGDGIEDYLWEYVVPYFMQNKVIGVNIKRLNEAIKQSNSGTPLIDENISQPDFQKLFASDLTYKGIFDQLKRMGARNLAVNDYFRDNVAIGSEINNGDIFSGDVTEENHLLYITSFFNTISGWNKTWRTSGVDNLELLIEHEKDVKNPIKNSGVAEVALMYNGDALFAHFGGANGRDYGNQIQVILPKNPTFMLDGIIIPKYVGNSYSEWERVHQVLYDVFQGAETSFFLDDQKNQIFEGYASNQNRVFKTFDMVNYVPAFKHLHDYVENEYFIDENAKVDDKGKAFIMSTRNLNQLIDVNHIIMSISPTLEQKVKQLYQLRISE